MRITFNIPECTRNERNSHCDVLRIAPVRVANLVLDDAIAAIQTSRLRPIEVITNLFNLILDSGVIPTNWCLSIIMSLYKNKGSVNDPDNYRGITLPSCLSKLFTSALNNIITHFLERFDSI